MAARGAIHEKMLHELMKHPYVRRRPPKATGREVFGQRFFEEVLKMAKRYRVSGEDLVATVTAFSAESIAYNYNRFILPKVDVEEIILCGGGTYNKKLVKLLQKKLEPIRFTNVKDCIGIPIEAREVVAVAIITNETLLGNPSNVTNATGAKRHVILGDITPGW